MCGQLLQDRQEEILSSRELEQVLAASCGSPVTVWQAQLVFAIGNAMDGAGLGLNGQLSLHLACML